LVDIPLVKFPYTDANLDAVVNKHNLAGVRNLVICSRKKEYTIIAFEYREFILNDHLKRLEIELQKEKKKAGSVVDYRHRSPNGIRVVENLTFAAKGRTGRIIADDEDSGIEIGVHWDNGADSHNLKCNKHGRQSLL
jgi:hypothetical protein